MDNNLVASMQANKNNKRRFNDDQVKFMESMFSSESRPGPKNKQQIADQLGLDPRQVAVWFQNRRARSKSKQTARDYNILKASYDSLVSKFESLKKENQSLIMEVQKLMGLIERPKVSISDSTPATSSNNGESVSLGSAEKHMAQPKDYIPNMLCETKPEGFKNFEQEIDYQDNLNMVESVDGSLASSRNNSNLEPTYPIEHNCVSDWWEFCT